MNPLRQSTPRHASLAEQTVNLLHLHVIISLYKPEQDQRICYYITGKSVMWTRYVKARRTTPAQRNNRKQLQAPTFALTEKTTADRSAFPRAEEEAARPCDATARWPYGKYDAMMYFSLALEFWAQNLLLF